MSAHTPGPWELRPDDMGGLSKLIYPQGSEYPTAAVTGYWGRDGHTLPNARLIAAAPELLEALQEMVDGDAEAIDEAKALGVPFPEEMLKAYRKAIAAIAKATGEST